MYKIFNQIKNLLLFTDSLNISVLYKSSWSLFWTTDTLSQLLRKNSIRCLKSYQKLLQTGSQIDVLLTRTLRQKNKLRGFTFYAAGLELCCKLNFKMLKDAL